MTVAAIDAQSLFAHRGLHDGNLAPNSLGAIVAAADAGYGVEFDVHLSADGVPFVSHDASTLADTGTDWQIAQTRSEHLRELRFRVGGEPLASLDDVLAVVPPTTPLLIEVKPTTRVRETVAALAMRLHGRTQASHLQSFQPAVVVAAKRALPAVAVGQLCEAPNGSMPVGERWFWTLQASNAWARPDFLAVYLSALGSRATTFWRQRLRCPLLGWTVADSDDVAACRAVGAGIIFDRIRP